MLHWPNLLEPMAFTCPSLRRSKQCAFPAGNLCVRCLCGQQWKYHLRVQAWHHANDGYVVVAVEEQCPVATGGNLLIGGTANWWRNFTLMVFIIATSCCQTIAAKKYCVSVAASCLCVAHTSRQHRDVAFTPIVAAECDGVAIAAKKACVDTPG